jgi:maltose alpha-D-glucosyltransferase/alpha-amylase
MAIQYWYQKAVFYEVSVRAFYDSNADGIGDLAGLTQKLDYFVSLGVDCLWLLPIYESPLRDGGYDISNFEMIDPVYGTITDFSRLISEAHKRNLKVVMDLVMNHTSDQHPWFKAARENRESPYHDYYVWSDTDQKYADARIIFLDTEKSNWAWNEATREYYWHRFYSHQPDLNYDNPAVINEMFKIMETWLALGIDGFRVDAVPYLIERDGTNCENLPETHAILKQMRAFVEEKYPGTVLLCEANQWPKEVVEYLGDGDEFHMAFNFPLMPRIFMALKKADSSPIQWAMEQLPPIPENCQWGTFLRNHDELTLEMVTEEERRYLWEGYSPDRRYRLNLGIRRRLAPLLENNRKKIELAFSLLFSLPGSPVLYYGDEIGMGDNVSLFDRNGLRTPMQWTPDKTAGFSSAAQLYAPPITDPEYDSSTVNVERQEVDLNSLWQTFRKMIAIRRQQPVFASHNFTWIDCGEPRAAVFERSSGDSSIIAAHNLSGETLQVEIPISGPTIGGFDDLFTGVTYPVQNRQLALTLLAYQYLWLKASDAVSL